MIIADQFNKLRINTYPIGINNTTMDHHVTDPAKIAQSENGYKGVVARVIAFEVLKLPRKCECCGAEGRVQVHHINKDRDNNSRENLKVLCRSCHNKVHGVIPPKKTLTSEEELSALSEMNKKQRQKKSAPLLMKRVAATQAYREKWGIIP